ncbi:MAG TPA: glycosyl transferase, partial [Moraxellaceae bacterium]|nr:glycosyl transferase [Moraxellaceae bacterium]
MNYWWLIPAVGLLSLVMTGGVRHYARKRSILDIPNDRSSHTIPTPRGGGMAIVVAFLLSLPVFLLTGDIGWPFAVAMLGAAIIVALIG